MRRIGLLASLALMVGCGGGGGGGSAAPVVPPPAIPTVVSLTLAPASLALELEGDPEALTVTATWSDGSVSAVSAGWTTLGLPGIVSLGASPSSSILVTPSAIGSATVRASFSGRIVDATVTVAWTVPSQPGLTYGIQIDGAEITWGTAVSGIYEYSGDPGEIPRTVVEDALFYGVTGTSMSKDGSKIYVNVLGAMYAVSPTTGIITPLGSIPEAGRYGLVTTTDGKLVTFAEDGSIWKFDPATGLSTDLGSDSEFQLATAMGPGDVMYSYEFWTGYIRRRTIGAVASAPTTFGVGEAMWAGGGLCATKAGEVFYNALSSTDIRRMVDLNGDGDALDAGEDSVFASLPYTWAVESTSYLQTIHPAGGRSVLINVVPLETVDGYVGLWWARDTDGDGAADAVAMHTSDGVATDEMWSLTSTR